jgi:drug/metabolite transporter (DMT)-like permease
MAELANCPKCGSDNVQRKAAVVDGKSGKPIRPRAAIIGGLLTFVGACLILGGIAISRQIPDALWLYVILGAIFCVPGVLGLSNYLRGIKTIKSTCGACGHQWAQKRDATPSGEPCIHCGKPDVLVKTSTVDRKTKAELVGGQFSSLVVSGIALLIVVGALLFALDVWRTGNSGIIRWTYGSTVAGLGILALGLGLARAIAVAPYRYFTADRAAMFTYMCIACGQDWKRLEDGTPVAEDEAPKAPLPS